MLFTAKLSIAQTADQSKKKMIDSIKHMYIVEASLRNPLLRQATISTDIIAPADMQSFLHGKRLFDAKIKNIRTNAIFNVPIKSWGEKLRDSDRQYFPATY